MGQTHRANVYVLFEMTMTLLSKHRRPGSANERGRKRRGQGANRRDYGDDDDDDDDFLSSDEDESDDDLGDSDEDDLDENARFERREERRNYRRTNRSSSRGA